MFEDQKVELLPERTTMHSFTSWTSILSANHASALALNVANITARGAQYNSASALAMAGSVVSH